MLNLELMAFLYLLGPTIRPDFEGFIWVFAKRPGLLGQRQIPGAEHPTGSRCWCASSKVEFLLGEAMKGHF